MRIAQRLYEGVDIGGETVGLITYMRTDGVDARRRGDRRARAQLIGSELRRPLSCRPRRASTRARRRTRRRRTRRSARPTCSRRPADVARASRRRPAPALRADLEAHRGEPDGIGGARPGRDRHRRRDRQDCVLRATGSVVVFDGFLKLYQEDRDDAGPRTRRRRPPPAGDAAGRAARAAARSTPEQHFTQPPPRYTEASLVKKLEELGIGRPSTYASIIQVLQDRDYVRLDKQRFVPEDRGRLVTAFLTSFFERYVEYNFTADLENQLDDISGGRIDWKEVLRDFWQRLLRGGRRHQGPDDRPGDRRARRGARAAISSPTTGGGRDPRLCPGCGAGRLGLKLGKFGAFIGCSNYPECRYTRAARHRGRQRRGRDAATADPRARRRSRRPASRSALQQGPLRASTSSSARARTAASRSASSLPQGMSAGRYRSRDRVAAAVAAARDRPASRDRRADHRRHRPVRRLTSSTARSSTRSAPMTTC